MSLIITREFVHHMPPVIGFKIDVFECFHQSLTLKQLLMEVKSFHIFIQDQHFSQDHCNQRNLDSHLHQVIFGGMAMLWELPALTR